MKQHKVWHFENGVGNGEHSINWKKNAKFAINLKKYKIWRRCKYVLIIKIVKKIKRKMKPSL